MAIPTYQHIEDDLQRHVGKPRQIHTFTRAVSNSNVENYDTGLGKPDSKPLFYTTDLLALIISLTCFICAVCVITPRLTFSWQLGSELQIVVLGFLLGVMSLCTQTVLPTLLLVIEARFGKSRLQNYQAILTSRFLSSHISFVWRSVLFMFVILPIGLGVAYKRFFGGISTVAIHTVAFQNASYGVAYPSLGDYSRMNNTVYELMSCNAGLWSIYYNDSLVPKSEDYPVALGYNMVLLDGGTAALLDMPSQDYLNWIQGNLRTNETWEVSASVNATVARNNETLTTRLRNDDEFFNNTLLHSLKYGRDFTLNTFYSWTANTTLGLFPIYLTNTNEAACMLGYYNSSEVYPVSLYMGSDYYDSDTEPFRQVADTFSLTRERCTARWRIDKQKVTLLDGACDPDSSSVVSQELIDDAPYSLDTLPVLIHSLDDFRDVRSQSPWRLPAYASAVASSYWARATFMIKVGNVNTSSFYRPHNEEIHSSVATLRASWLLFLVLSVQPVITIIAVVSIACFHSVPIGRGFGLVSVLAGINPAGLHVLRGAGLSGETIRSVTLKSRVRVRNPMSAVETDIQSMRHYMEYHVASESDDENVPETRIERKERYD